MKAGNMKYRLQLLQPVSTTNDFGEEETTYKATRTVWAERVKFSGSRSEEVGEHFPNYHTEYNVRDAHPIEENWRVQQLGGNLYTVILLSGKTPMGINIIPEAS